jgi:hypothetical protein
VSSANGTALDDSRPNSHTWALPPADAYGKRHLYVTLERRKQTECMPPVENAVHARLAQSCRARAKVEVDLEIRAGTRGRTSGALGCFPAMPG